MDHEAGNNFEERDKRNYRSLGQKRGRTEDYSKEKRIRLDAAADENASGYIMDIYDACRYGLVFDNVPEIVGSGNSGEVKKALWRGTRVAVKHWNGQSYEGFECFINEITTLRTMGKFCPSLFGSVIPRMFLSSKGIADKHLREFKPLLVTEFVGDEIYRDKEGRLCRVDNANGELEHISDVDEQIIYEEAMEGLKELQKYWILHGSVNLRNIRVKREDPELNEMKRCPWRVWWIDFGRSEFATISTRSYMGDECQRCSLLFETRKLQPSSVTEDGRRLATSANAEGNNPERSSE